MSPDDEYWEDKIRHLKSLFKIHLEEENNLFLNVRKVLNDELIILLGKKLENGKQQIMKTKL